MIPVLLGLGSNLGERPRILRAALRSLAGEARMRLRGHSSLIETEPLGGSVQGRFVNAVAWWEVAIEPYALLHRLALEERRRGRVRPAVHHGPRTLDLDILIFGALTCSEPRLEIPHPRMLERAFVMEPALQIASRWIHPGRGRRLAELWGGPEIPVAPPLPAL